MDFKYPSKYYYLVRRKSQYQNKYKDRDVSPITHYCSKHFASLEHEAEGHSNRNHSPLNRKYLKASDLQRVQLETLDNRKHAEYEQSDQNHMGATFVKHVGRKRHRKERSNDELADRINALKD